MAERRAPGSGARHGATDPAHRLAALTGGGPRGGPVVGLSGPRRASAEEPASADEPAAADPTTRVVAGSWRDGFVRRWGAPPRAALACLVLCLAVVAGLGARAVTADRGIRESVPAAGARRDDGARAVPAAATTGGLPGASAGPATTATQMSQPGAPTVTGQAAGSVLVHVVGAVRRPGVVTLPVGARVLDAVTAAGGATRRAELAAVNLARPVVDGEQLRVPAKGETVAPVEGGAVGGTAGGPSGSGSGSGAGVGAGSPAARVDLNTADVAGLDTLPGIGPVLAGRILQWRTTNGRFTSVDELAEVQGIGDRLLEGLRDLVTVS